MLSLEVEHAQYDDQTDGKIVTNKYHENTPNMKKKGLAAKRRILLNLAYHNVKGLSIARNEKAKGERTG